MRKLKRIDKSRVLEYLALIQSKDLDILNLVQWLAHTSNGLFEIEEVTKKKKKGTWL